MVTLKTSLWISSAHHLTSPYEGKCLSLHGHNWRIALEITGEKNECGMVVDFSRVKGYFKQFDHTDLNEIFDQPTVENMVEVFARGIKGLEPGIKKVKVSLEETEGNSVEFEC